MEDVNRKNDKSSKEKHQDNRKSSNEKEKSNFEHSLVEPPSKLDIKHVLVKEDLSSEKIFREKDHA